MHRRHTIPSTRPHPPTSPLLLPSSVWYIPFLVLLFLVPQSNATPSIPSFLVSNTSNEIRQQQHSTTGVIDGRRIAARRFRFPSSATILQSKNSIAKSNHYRRHTTTHNHHRLHMMIPPFDSTTHLQSAVEFFDGSTITNPVVVSGFFWSRIVQNIKYVVLGQLVAVGVFGGFVLVASDQLTKLGEFVENSLFKGEKGVVRRGVVVVVEEGGRLQSQPLDYTKLLLCLTIDTIGTSSEFLPFFIGEASDLLYAPLAALALRSLFGRSNVVFGVEFIEELVPFADVLPLATICWVVESFAGGSDLARVLQIGDFGVVDDDGGEGRGVSSRTGGRNEKDS